jgi:hypothetical protein
LGQIRARWIVDPEKSLPSVEDVARLPIELCIRADLKPRRVVQMRAHELQREDTHADRGHEKAQKAQNGCSTFSQ